MGRGLAWRVLIWCALSVVFAGTAGLSTDDAPSPPEGLSPEFQAETVTAPAPSEEFLPARQVPVPTGDVPSPVAPSELIPGQCVPVVVPVPERVGEFIEFKADHLRTTFEDGRPVLTVAEGNVTACYKNMAITAQCGKADYKTNLASFEGNVVFQVGVQTVQGESICLNMRTGQWSFGSAESVITPQFLKGYIKAPLYAHSDRFQGIRDRRITAFGAQVTSCNLDHAHYELVSRSVSVYPDSKIVFRDVTAYLLGRRLITLPRIVVPIRDIERNPTIIPRVGESVEEGAFLKTAFSYVGTRTQSGALLLDLMTRKGIGTGLRHNYEFPKASGELYAYYIYDRNIDKNTFTGNFSHDQRIGTVKANAAVNFRSNSYLYAPNSRSLDGRLTLTRNRLGARSSLVVNQSINDVFTRTSRLAGNLRHNQLFGDDISLDTAFDYTAFRSTGKTRARLTSQMLLLKKEEKFDWSISAQDLADLSDEAFVGGGRFAGIERLPEVALVSDSTRLGRVLPFGLPARLKLSYGQFVELPADTHLGRAYLDIDTPIKRYPLSTTWTFGAGAGFRQFLYSDDTAQYAIDANAEISKRLGPTSKFAFTYRYQQPRGFTPFRFDYVGKYNILNTSLNFQESKKLRLSVLGGYNFEQKKFPWRDITFRCAYQPTESFLLYTATGYDINRSRWRTLINQIRIRLGEDFKLDLASRYDTTRSKLAVIKMQLDTKLGPKMRLQALAGYNGLTGRFDYRSVMLTRDLHCWEASLVYVNQGGFYRNEGFFLNFRIKAFPLVQNYGMGPFGQAQDTSVGQVY